ncbi:UBC-like protein [Fragilariopsis cylindrus CCMP1102]|uniref:E2 ubiquitin-conjugating enzyme n=1 Tax=Fragilariopsis cylindrus CCMP1102 TaxID=635003 RepID=A0A1E7EUX3_9STRA|nr:UBC-like protein [Fragilariopsis cylindrus CCMP1102]|eukprot:OEU09604.1 UBC-like protein [Fragilariopsis cylindrus CCMP1102]
MATDICTRRLTKELKSLMKDPIRSPTITVAPNEKNILEVHYVIEGSEKTPFAGGIYHGKLLFPKDYPLKPPSVIMITKNGRFQPNRRLCLSMSDFHPESWNPMWSVSTILTGLYSFMIESQPTLGSIESTKSQKEKFARQSLDYNVRDPTFCKLFPEYVILQKERLAARQAALGISGSSTTDASNTMISQESTVQFEK